MVGLGQVMVMVGLGQVMVMVGLGQVKVRLGQGRRVVSTTARVTAERQRVEWEASRIAAVSDCQ